VDSNTVDTLAVYNESTLKRPAAQAGFTLIENLVTIFIIGSLIALFSAAIHLLRLTTDAKYEDVALRIASHRLEEERSLGYASTTSGSFSDSLMSQLPSGAGTTTVTDYGSKIRLVDITVSWRGFSSITRSVALTTLLTDIGGIK